MRVLNSRPRDQAAELSQLLRAAGFDTVDVPAIETIAAFDPTEMALVAERLRRNAYAWAVLASVNAGRYLIAAIDVPELASMRVLCGAGTAQRLGLHNATTLARFSAAAALQELLRHHQSGMRVLVPRAAEGRDELILGLERAGAIVDAPVVYRTRAADIGPWCPVDAITLCSPSAVAALVAAWSAPIMNGARIVCLGDTTAHAARERGLRVDAVAAQTGMPALVGAVRSVLRTEAAV